MIVDTEDGSKYTLFQLPNNLMQHNYESIIKKGGIEDQ